MDEKRNGGDGPEREGRPGGDGSGDPAGRGDGGDRPDDDAPTGDLSGRTSASSFGGRSSVGGGARSGSGAGSGSGSGGGLSGWGTDSSGQILGRGSADLGGQWIGPYRVLDRLGEGGMGIVYLAEQTKPIQRRVALKILKPGMDSESILARFEAERQVLERMDHPNIARILDAGMTEQGRPYFVMEYVKGVPITEHADREKLDVDERVELFIQVCEAVQHAHHKGVIHRDIKPSNILVEFDETRTAPKVIDFGIARLTDQSGNTPAFTHHGQLIGTPEYMSPEQAEMSAQEIDTRTDVYTLGVVLYELLVGVKPFEGQALREAGLEGIRRMIRELDPMVPSRRLRSLPLEGETTLETVTRTRRMDTRRLVRVMKNDLDWVIMKCLEKRRDRRYSTPSELALDLKRYLTGETVLTGPPRVTYRVGKFVRRYRVGVSAAAAVLAVFLLGFGATVWQWQRAVSAEESAVASERRTLELATRLVSSFQEEVEPLPGSRRARQSLLELGTEPLDLAMRRGSGDAGALLTLAEAYDRLGDAAGGLRTAHAGDLDLAARHWGRARELRERVASMDEGGDTGRAGVGLALSWLRFGDLERERSALEASAAAYREGLDALASLPEAARSGRDGLLARALLEVSLANTLGRRGWPVEGEVERTREREALYGSAKDVTRRLVASAVDDETLSARARALSNWGSFLREDGRASEALEPLEESRRIREQLVSSDPSNSVHRRELAATAAMLGLALGRGGDQRGSLARLGEARGHYEFLVEADPTDDEARSRLSQVYEMIGSFREEPSERIAAYRRAVEESEAVLRGGSDLEDTLRLARQERMLGALLHASGASVEAYRRFGAAFGRLRSAARVQPGNAGAMFLLGDVGTRRVVTLAAMDVDGETRGRFEALRDELLAVVRELEQSDPAIAEAERAAETLRESAASCDERIAELDASADAG